MCHERLAVVRRCYGEDEGGPLEAACQEEASNRPLLLRLRDVVVSELGKGAGMTASGAYQGDERKRTVDDVSKRSRCCQNRESPVVPGQVCGEPEACAGGSRYIGGMTLIQASTWNVGTCMVDVKGQSQVVIPTMANTKAACRGGAARSSGEASVMDVERRGGVILLMKLINLIEGMS